MASKGLDLSLMIWTLDRRQLGLIDPINIDATFLNARETMHSWRSTPLGSVTLSTNGNLVDMVPDDP